ncbi:MAG: pentapeptide repeat-containing protein [Acidobacteriaceae bacterium]|nr:pentapeptide repeat-containing protein [Acidobacteriaceae bacterium]
MRNRFLHRIALILLFSTCAFPNPWIKPIIRNDPARTFFYEQDFVADPTLVALPNQVAVLTLLPASGTSPSLQQHKVRYQLSSGAYNFCLQGDPSLTTMTVTDPSGQVVVNVNVNACSTIGNLPANTYGISILHDPAKVPGKPRMIFVQLPAPHVKTINADGTPKSGYWALQPDPAQDPNGTGRAGRLVALPEQELVPPNSGTTEEVIGMPLAADWTSTEFDDTALVRLDAPKLYSHDIPLNFVSIATQQGANPVLFGTSAGSNPLPNLLDQIVIDDRTDGAVRVGVTSQTVYPIFVNLVPFFYTSPRWAFVDKTSFLTFPPFVALPPLPVTPPPPSLLARLLFRVFPESKNLPTPALEEREVEFFQSCGYGGDAAVFNRDIANLAALASSTAKVNQAAAVKLGPNTQVILYSEPGFAGNSQTISSDTNCFDSLPIGTSIGSLQIRSLVAPFSVSSDCSSCQLQGINLSNSLLDGASLSGTNLSNANLTSASLIGAALEDVNLSHATISQAHFDQADMKGTSWFGVDLRTAASFANLILDRASGFGAADLEGVNLTGASLREIDFNFTNLSHATLSHVDLTGANLVQSQLIGTVLTNNAILQKADLTFSTLNGAQLPGADLTNASLIYAKAGADFTGAHLDGSYFVFTDLSSATLNGASLNGSELSLAVLAGATLNGQTTFAGADIGNADYTLGQLQVANLYQAVFDKNTFAYMNLSGINFSGASFKGATFQNITCGGPTNFTGANLTSATFKQDPPNSLSSCNFNGATMQKASFQTDAAGLSIKLGSSTFNGAHMQGAQLVGADLTGTDLTGADLTGANFQSAILTKPLSLNNATLDGALGLAGNDLSGAPLEYASLRGTNLSGTKLYGAHLNSANLEGADFSSAQLQGATLDQANLTGANLYGAFLSNDTQGQVDSAATAVQAHLKNANLSYATLSGVDFSYANFYGTTPAGQNTCATTKDNYQGFTKNCASAHGATMTDTHFPDAYLFGVDFTDAAMRGVDFSRAILIGANLGATLGTDPNSGARTLLFRSFLQGANLGSATLNNAVTASGAFVDFHPGGNIVYVYLSGLNHNQFACPGCTLPRADVCVEIYYLQPSTVPGAGNLQNLTPCPDGSPNTNGCGNLDASGDWQSPLLKSATSVVPLFWYDNPVHKPPTFLPAWQNSQSGVPQIERCNGLAPTFNW